MSVLASMVLGFLAVIGNYVLPDKIFGYLLATSGAVALFVYLSIAVSQLVLGKSMRARDQVPAVRMWLFPYLTGLVIVFIVAVLVLMAFDSDQREAITLSTISAVIIVAIGVWMQKRHGDRGYDAPDEAKAAAPGAPGPKR